MESRLVWSTVAGGGTEPESGPLADTRARDWGHSRRSLAPGWANPPLTRRVVCTEVDDDAVLRGHHVASKARPQSARFLADLELVVHTRTFEHLESIDDACRRQ
jgi:hypothetical protein